MSDYLGHLVARTLAPDTSVRPRIPSIFEPASGLAPLGLAPDPEADTELQTEPSTPKAAFEAPRGAVSVDPPPDPGANSKLQTVSSFPTSILKPPHESVVTGRPGDTRGDVAFQTEPPAPAFDAPPALPKSVEPAPAVSQVVPNYVTLRPPQRDSPLVSLVPVQIRPATPSPATAEALVPAAPPKIGPLERIEPVGQPNLPATGTSLDMDPSQAPHEGAPTSQLRAAPSSPRPPDPGHAGILIRPVRPDRAASPLPDTDSRPRGATSPADRPAPASPPAIHVTIGCVEVRASAPASTPPRAKSKKEPVMSLETYLQRRAEGGRR